MQMLQAVAITAAFALNRFSEYASHCGVLAYGGYLAVTGRTVGTVTFCSMSSSFPTNQILSQFYTQAQSALAGLERIFCCWMNPLNLKTQCG